MAGGTQPAACINECFVSVVNERVMGRLIIV